MSGFEADENHIHLNDYFPKEFRNIFEMTAVATTILEIWNVKLQMQFPLYTFHLIASINKEDGEITLRFYRFRDYEGPWLNMDAIDNYEEEALLIIET
ncbi:MAG: hypothetical protein M0031_12740 [Thermaerobacter sp.]|jgi:hypothetical protein|nr:hypothetical protein [Thermaerobacter sp.]